MSHPDRKKPTGPYIRKQWERVRTPTIFTGETKVQATSGNDTDVNSIMARFTRTGQLPPATSEPQYADVTALQEDLTEILERGREAQATLDEIRLEAQNRVKNQNKEKPKSEKTEQTQQEAQEEQANIET